MTNLGAVNPSPVMSERASPSPGQAYGANLAELDREMAKDFDQALQGNFESIEAVLDEVFDEKAELVQKADGSPAIQKPPPREQIDHGTAPSASATAVAAADAQSGVKDNFSPAMVAVNTVAASPASLANHTEAVSIGAASTIPVSRSVLPDRAPAEPKAEPKPDVPPQHSPMVGDAPPANQPLPASEPSTLVRLLMMVNAPLRMAPPGVRPVIDVLAITLLLWVPIVWVMAIIHLRGAEANTGPATTPDEIGAVSADVQPAASSSSH